MEQEKNKSSIAGIIISLVVGLIIGGATIYFLANKEIITINTVSSSKVDSNASNNSETTNTNQDESKKENVTYPTSYTISNCLNCKSDFVNVEVSTEHFGDDSYMSIKESLDGKSFVLTMNYDKSNYNKTGTKDFNISINPNEVSKYTIGSTYQASENGIVLFVMKDGSIKYILEESVSNDNPTVVTPENISDVTRIITVGYLTNSTGSYTSTSVQRSDGNFYSLREVTQK